ncbi:MAG: PH domain-containing protein [Actinobacteria bacterium]|nr:PH domain-containing protein [Actinomycetota bacterium]
MSRLDRLVRSVGPRMDEAEVLIASVLGHRPDGRGHLALVATDRRLLLVTEGFARTMVDELSYAGITSFSLTDDPSGTVVEVVAREARWRLERIEASPEARVALALIERRCLRPDGSLVPPRRQPPRRVRVLLPEVELVERGPS